MKSYSVLTLSRFSDHLDRCLSSIFVMQPNLALKDIYVVDDGLSPEIKERWKVNYIEGQKPFIFARNFNIGIQSTPKDQDVFFLGDDGTLLTPNGIDQLSARVQKMPHIGLISPVILGPVKNFFQIQGILNEFVTSKDLAGLPGYCPTIIFIAVYIKRIALDSVGNIPENLTGYGFEDDYFSTKMREFNLDWCIDPEIVVKHGYGKYPAASSYHRAGMDPEKMMEINRKIYEDLMNNE